MKIEHIYWIAAFLDGEGWFGISNKTPSIHVSSNDRDLLEKFRVYSKISNQIYKYEDGDPNHRTQYRVILSSSLAIQWMMTIYPIMCKRRQATIIEVISYWKTQKARNVCSQGHLISGSNVIYELNGKRRCKICRQNWSKLRLA